MKKIICILLCVITVSTATLLSGCASLMTGPEKALNNFEKAFNDRNLDGIVNILEPNMQAEVKMQMEFAKGTLGFIGQAAGIGDISEFLTDDVISGALGGVINEEYGDSILNIEVVSEEYSADKKEATVTANFIFDDQVETEILYMIEISGDWYLDKDEN